MAILAKLVVSSVKSFFKKNVKFYFLALLQIQKGEIKLSLKYMAEFPHIKSITVYHICFIYEISYEIKNLRRCNKLLHKIT